MVRIVICTSKFGDKPAIVLLFIAEVVTLLKLCRIRGLHTQHLRIDAVFKDSSACSHSFFLLLIMLIDVFVELAHSVVTGDLLFEELVVSLFHLDDIFDERVDPFRLHDLQLVLADATVALQVLALF